MNRYSKRKFAQAVVSLLEEYQLSELVPVIAEAIIAQKWTHDIPHLVHEIARVLEEERGMVEAEITSARPLTTSVLNELTSWVQEYTSAKNVTLSLREDPTLLGGARLTTENFEVDLSVQRHFNRLLHTYHAKNFS